MHARGGCKSRCSFSNSVSMTSPRPRSTTTRRATIGPGDQVAERKADQGVRFAGPARRPMDEFVRLWDPPPTRDNLAARQPVAPGDTVWRFALRHPIYN